MFARKFIKATKRDRDVNNPWQMLVIALLFFGPSVFALTGTSGAVMFHHATRRSPGDIRQVVSPGVIHAYGWFGLIASGLLISLYLWTRREIRRDADSDQVL